MWKRVHVECTTMTSPPKRAPYNNHNILITEHDVIDILGRVGIRIPSFPDFDKFIQAMTHMSYVRKDMNTMSVQEYRDTEEGRHIREDCVPLQSTSYENLEWLGDLIANNKIGLYLYQRYGSYCQEGFLTMMKTRLVDKKTFAEFSMSIGLNRFLLISESMEHIGKRTNISNLEDAFEAFIGALYFNAGDGACEALIMYILESHVDFAEIIAKNTNYKDLLQQHYHANKWHHPKYKIVRCEGPSHATIFTCSVLGMDGKTAFEYGTGNTRVLSEQDAARKAMIKLDILDEY